MIVKEFNIVNFLVNNGIVMVLIIPVIAADILQPTLFSTGNTSNAASNVVLHSIIVCGVLDYLIIKGTDLSAERMAGLPACVAGTLLQKPDYSSKFWESLLNFGIWQVLVVLLICIAVCDISGCINGLVTSFLQAPVFISTLGMQLIIYNVCPVYTDVTPIGGYHAAYTEVAKGKLFGMMPYLFIITLVVGIMMWLIHNKTPHGKYMYATGGSEQAAEVSNMGTKRTKIIIYITAAALYALGGFPIGIKPGGSSISTGQGWELKAIAAYIIGGVSVSGGIERASGALTGVLAFRILETCFQYLGADTDYQYITQGIAIVVVTTLDIRKHIAKK